MNINPCSEVKPDSSEVNQVKIMQSLCIGKISNMLGTGLNRYLISVTKRLSF